jgi:uncharacterized repeat protein (TIGR03803 family)
VDGQFPKGRLLQATDGSFYGITPYGGVYGQGTIFKVTAEGALTTLYSFCSLTNCADGLYAAGRLDSSNRRELLWNHPVWRICRYVYLL